jgi:Flp pilus assembly protein TadG
VSTARGRTWWRGLGVYGSDERGASAAEFALWITVMALPILNTVDLGMYAFKSMQVREAAQAGAQAVEVKCGYAGNVPAATSCSGASTLIDSAVQTTSLGSNVTATTKNEGYYCHNTSGALVAANSVSGSNPWSISGTAGTGGSCSNGDSPGDYVIVTTTYTYSPLFSSARLLSLFRASSTITQTAWMRIN